MPRAVYVLRMVRDWVDWHRAYERPESSLTARRAIVTEMVVAALDRAAQGEIRCLSLCAGDAQDLVGALSGHERADDVVGAVVEIDRELADRAATALAGTAASIEARCADAADPAAFADVTPVDVLLLVGLFGNICDDDIRRTIAAVPALCRPAATVLWTRHRREPDATPMIRRAFAGAGCVNVTFESPGAGSFAIGAERFDGTSGTAHLDGSLFTFSDDLW